MALAHQISLNDLSGREYDPLRNAINLAGDTMPLDYERGKVVFNLRHVMRKELSTIDQRSVERGQNRSAYDANLIRTILPTIQTLTRSVREFGELFVGMVEGPFMLLLRETTRGKFLSYAQQNPRHPVTINWTTEYEGGRVWIVRPVNVDDGYRLEFRIPRVLEEWIYQTSTDIRGRALSAKERYLSRIMIYRSEEAGDRLYVLEFDAAASERARGTLLETTP